MMGDISKYRAEQPPVICAKCKGVTNSFTPAGATGKPDKIESTALHFGLPTTRYGVLLIRVECHGEKQDIAATFKWLESNRNRPIDAFSDQPNDYGLRDMIERDGFSLPTSIQQCAYQLEAPKTVDGRALIQSIRECLKRGRECGYDDAERLRYRNALDELDQLDSVVGAVNAAKSDTHGKYVLARFVRRMDAELVANEAKGDWNAWQPSIGEMIDELKHHTNKPTAALAHSVDVPIGTGVVTELSADLANLCMKVYQQFGTPVDRPKRWINDALPNPIAGTEHDKRLSGPEIAIKPEPERLPALGPGMPGDQGYQ